MTGEVTSDRPLCESSASNVQSTQHVINDLLGELFCQSGVFISTQIDVEHLTNNVFPAVSK